MTSGISIRHRMEYGLFRVADALLRLLPRGAVLALGRGLGRCFRLLSARHRRIVRENLRGCGLSLDEKGVQALSRDCFAHFGSVGLGLFPLLHASREDLDRWVRIEGLEHFDALKASGRGFIQLTAHYGDWEAVALAQSAKGRTLAVIGRDLDNPLLAPLMIRLRTRFGNRQIAKDGAVRETLKALKAGEGVGFLLDQDALTMGVWVRFLGRWASTFPTAAMLAVRCRVPILPVFSWPEPDGTLRVRFEPPLELPATGNPERDVWTATQLMTRRIEEQILRDPRWWFWMHRRFKTRPGEGHPLPAPLPPPEWVEDFDNHTTRG